MRALEIADTLRKKYRNDIKQHLQMSEMRTKTLQCGVSLYPAIIPGVFASGVLRGCVERERRSPIHIAVKSSSITETESNLLCSPSSPISIAELSLSFSFWKIRIVPVAFDAFFEPPGWTDGVDIKWLPYRIELT